MFENEKLKAVMISARDYPENSVPFLKGVESGYDLDLRTPLFDEFDRSVVAEKWASILYSGSQDMAQELVDMEETQQAKLGTISRRKPFRDRQEDVEAYYRGQFVGEYGLTELDRMQELNGYSPISNSPDFPYRRLRPVSHETAAYQLPLNTNSGLPLFLKRKDALRESIAMAKSGKSYPAMCGWRGSSGQTGEYYPKQRVVWMFPFSQNINEARYQSVMLPYYAKKVSHFAALTSMDEVDLQVTDLIDTLPDGGKVIATDYTKYDQSLRSQQEWIFSRMRNMFQVLHWQDIGRLEHSFATIPILCTTELMFEGEHGVPSGSVLTNIGESTVNIDVQMSSPVVIGTNFQVQGDDACGAVWDVDKHLRHLESCGFVINPEKQYVSGHSTVYLQRLHHQAHRVDGILRGIYPTMRALNSLLGMERFHSNWDKTMESLRTLAILENCKWHPYFREFVDFTVEFGDKYLQEFVNSLDDVHFRRSVVRKAKTIPGLFPTYNQQDRLSGLDAFESVRIIRS